MNFYKTFLDEKTLITNLKVVKLYRDLQSLIIDKIINNIVEEEFSIHDYSEKIRDDMQDYYLFE